jgi:hypothetical protein
MDSCRIIALPHSVTFWVATRPVNSIQLETIKNIMNPLTSKAEYV